MLHLFAELAAVLAPIVACTAIGVVIAWRGMDYSSQTIGQLVVYAAAPCLVLNRLAKLELHPKELLALSGASVAVLVAFVVVYAVALRALRLPQRTFLAPLVFSNCGNLGLPLSLYAFGEDDFGVSVAIFALWTVLQFVTAEVFWSGRARVSTLLTSPLTYAGPIGLTCALLEVPLPRWLDSTTELVGDLTVPMMLVTLGVSLKTLAVAELRQSLLLSALRIPLGGALAYAIATSFGMTAAARGILVLHSAMPTAVANYVFAVRHDRHPESVASFVVVSTFISIVTTPVLLWALR